MAKKLVIFGAGGQATSAADVAMAAGFDVECFVAPADAGKTLLGRPVVAALDSLENRLVCVALGDNAARARVAYELAQQFGTFEAPVLIHPSASVSLFAQLGAGTVVHAQASIGPRAVTGLFCVVNTQAALEHDSTLDDFASLGPRAVTGGHVSVGAYSAVAIGAVVKHGITVGRDCVLGANSYLDKNLPDLSLAYGTPAKIIRPRAAGEKYL